MGPILLVIITFVGLIMTLMFFDCVEKAENDNLKNQKPLPWKGKTYINVNRSRDWDSVKKIFDKEL